MRHTNIIISNYCDGIFISIDNFNKMTQVSEKIEQPVLEIKEPHFEIKEGEWKIRSSEKTLTQGKTYNFKFAKKSFLQKLFI